jgi:hypothetical protein
VDGHGLVSDDGSVTAVREKTRSVGGEAGEEAFEDGNRVAYMLVGNYMLWQGVGLVVQVLSGSCGLIEKLCLVA